MNKEENNPKKCPICGRPTYKESKYCIFHASAEEKTEKEFKEELKEYIKKIKEEDGDYDFEKFIFVGKIDFIKDLRINTFKKTVFRNATFEGGAVFRNATFEGETDFRNATFKEDACFDEIIFEEYAGFMDTLFKGDAGFIDTLFKGEANFRNTTFKGDTYFSDITFKGGADFYGTTIVQFADFSNTTFKEYADFRNATFKREIIFEGVTFEKRADFVRATFDEDMNFQVKSFNGDVSFKEVSISPGKKLNLKVENNKVNVSFERAYLEDVYLDISLVTGVLIDFNDVLFRNAKIKRYQITNHILQEEKKKFSEAKEIYLLLKNNFHSIGQYEDERWAYKKEKDMDRLSYSYSYYKENRKDKAKEEKFPILKWIKKGDFKKLIISTFSNMIYGYGESPRNVIFSAIFIIILFSVFFSSLGINSPEIIEMKSPTVQEIFNSNSEIISKGNLINKTTNYYIDCLYFSAITFTTLGYGDFRPLEGIGRILAGSEAFIGAFMMALFVYTFARRTGGR